MPLPGKPAGAFCLDELVAAAILAAGEGGILPPGMAALNTEVMGLARIFHTDFL